MFDRDGFEDRLWETFGLLPAFDAETRSLIADLAEEYSYER